MNLIRIICGLGITFLLISCSGGGGGDGASESPAPTNSAPVLELEVSYSVDEGTTEVTTLRASDADGDSLTYSLSGIDASSFSISSSTLNFNSAQSFESPGDSNGDGAFQITIQVSDGNGGSDSMSIDVNLINVLTGRIVDGPLADSTVFLDADGDRTQDSNESSTTTDGDGFFELSDQSRHCSTVADCDAVIVAVGGRDIFTGETLDDLRLYGAPHPEDFFAVTPLTTVLTAPPPFLDTQENFLGDLGVTLDATVVQSLDPWDDTAAPEELMKLNQQIGFLLLTVLSLNEDADPADVTNQLVEAVRNLPRSSGIDLADTATLTTLLEGNSSIGSTQVDRIASSLSALNGTIGDIAFVPQGVAASAVLAFTQTIFQDAVRQYDRGEISALDFDTATSILDLIDEIRQDVDLPDSDGDGNVDIVDRDDDGDTFSDRDDAFPYDSTEWLDTDGDGTGNNADTDDDSDGVVDEDDAFPLDPTESVDTDGDGIGNNADSDDDNDGVNDEADVFPLDPSESVDSDQDGIGNNADPDDDNDGIVDEDDAFPLDPTESVDTDGDGIGNNADSDDDNDGVNDEADVFPLDPSESVDSDQDGIGNNADPDDDNDGVVDEDDAFPLDSTESVDTDGDGIGNNADSDDDNDGVNDEADVFPLDPSESVDSDQDGIGNNADPDDDNDGVVDEDDAFPLDPTESVDTDGDGTGNNTDVDDDNDGVSDIRDPEPLDSTITPPTAVIATDRVNGLEPLLVRFSAAESIAGFGDDEITSYEWDFNGPSSADENVDFVFLSDGSYDVTLTLTNSDGLSHSVSTMIDVLPNSNTYSVAGEITVAPTLSVDSDVNDSISTPTSNDAIGSAQEISNPTSVGGYINRPGTGPDFDGLGHSATTGDYSDYYKIQARGRETVNLRIATRDVGDLDLYLYDENQDIVDYSISGTGHESVQIPDTPGTYYIEAYVYSGYSNYVLTIGAGLASVSSHGMNASSDLVIGDVIAKGSPVGQAAGMLQMAPTTSMRGGNGLSQPVLYRFGADMMSAMASSALSLAASSQGSPSEIELKLQTMLTAKMIASDKGVEFAEPNYMMKTQIEPNDSNYRYQWHYPKIRLPEAWDQTTGSGSVKVAVLDTGIVQTHPDLSGRLSSDGYDFVGFLSNGDGDGRDANPSDPGDGLDNNQCTNSSRRTSSFHGTHVAGTIGAATNNSSGVAGVTWSTEIMDLRVLGCGGGSSWDIAEALKYAAGLPNESGIIVSDPADIANMSLGGGGYSQFFQDAVNDVRAAGMIVIAAAGNDGDSSLNYPASYDGVVSVAATTLNDQRSYYSQFNSRVDIGAPGGDTTDDLDGNGDPDGVLSTVAEIRSGSIVSTFTYFQGTSMATPHVAGVAALMKSVNSNMTPDDFDSLIASGDITVDLGSPGYDDRFGHGRIDALLAVNAAAALGGGGGSDADDPAIGLGAYGLNYGSVLDELEIEVFNAGSGDLQIDSTSASSSFVGIEAPNTASGLGQYVVSVDRTSLEPGLYSETVTFSSSAAGQAEVTILFEVLAGGDRYGDAGTQYIFLINWETGVYTYETAIPTDGVYSFTFFNVDPGVYLLVTGSDPDNDGWVGDVGEALGIYPIEDAPRLLIINENKLDLTFTTAYKIPLADTLHIQTDSVSGTGTQCGSQNRGVAAAFEEDGSTGCVQLRRAGSDPKRRLDK